MYTDGYIKLSRKLLDWRWYKSKNTLVLFIHLLLRANYKEAVYLNKTIKRGQLVTSRKKLCEELDLSEQELKTAINHLKSTNEIAVETTTKYSIITILNYDEYLTLTNKSTNEQPTTNQQTTSEKPVINRQLTSEQPTSNQQATNEQPQYNKYKKYKKDNKYNKSINTRTGDLYELSDYEIEAFKRKVARFDD